MDRICLPCFGIVIEMDHPSEDEPASGRLVSDLRSGSGHHAVRYVAAVDGLEALILAHACAGVDVQSPAYIEGIETAVDAIFNNYA
jgi:hypothetical protein